MAPGDYSLSLDFQPSFNQRSEWLIQWVGGRTELLVRAWPFYHERSLEITAVLSEEVGEAVFRVATEVLRNLSLWERGVGLDGITVSGAFESLEISVPAFEFWSPRPKEIPHSLVSAVFEAVSNLYPGSRWPIFLGKLAVYFDWGPAARLVLGAPHRLRISARLSSTEEGELREIFSRVPASGELVVDMSSFEGMGTLLLPLFQTLTRREGATRWLGSSASERYLQALDIPDGNVEFLDDWPRGTEFVEFTCRSRGAAYAMAEAYEFIRRCKFLERWPEEEEAYHRYFPEPYLSYFRDEDGWDLLSMIDCFRNGEYELLPLKRPETGRPTGALPYLAFAYPYGGSECMEAFLSAFGMEVRD
jgi:hypothetical protein